MITSSGKLVVNCDTLGSELWYLGSCSMFNILQVVENWAVNSDTKVLNCDTWVVNNKFDLKKLSGQIWFLIKISSANLIFNPLNFSHLAKSKIFKQILLSNILSNTSNAVQNQWHY